MFKELMNEVNTKKKEQIGGKNVQVTPNINANVAIKQPQKKEAD